MTTEGVTTQPADEEKWWMLLRRAFGIPDIVSSKNRENAVTVALLSFSPPTPEQEKISAMGERLEHEIREGRENTARAVVGTIVKMGGRGDLDELFVPLSLNSQSKDAIGAKIAGELEDAEPFVDVALTHVIAYVKGQESRGPLEAD